MASDLEILEFLTIHTSCEGISFAAAWAVLKDFAKVLQDTCLIDIIQAFRWMTVIDSQSVVNDDIKSFLLVKRPEALASTQDDLIYCIAIRLFLVKIRTWTVAGTHPAVRCKIKFWHVLIWDALVDPSIPSTISIRCGRTSLISCRSKNHGGLSLISGQQVNPEWPLTGFVQNDDSNAALKVFMILGLRGGGPAKLLSNSEAEVSGNFRDIAHMESTNFEAVLSVTLTMVIDYYQW